MTLVPAYNTNGFYCHGLEDATRILGGLGYRGISLTPDVLHLDPFHSSPNELQDYRGLLEELGLALVVETGARFILDPQRKHYPALLTPGRGEERFDFLVRCLDMARALGSTILSFHSGSVAPHLDREETFDRLAGYVARLLEEAESRGIRLALEPEPGMFIESMADFKDLDERLNRDRSPSALFMTLDLGHLHITEAGSPVAAIEAFAEKIINVHVDDARDGLHEHLPLGRGEIAFTPLFSALDKLAKPLFLSVELSRHGHDAVRQASRSLEFLKSRVSL